jgi:hypothetical protein
LRTKFARGVLVATLLATASLVLPSSAFADKARTEVTVHKLVWNQEVSAFIGTVTSPRPRCATDRKVSIFRERGSKDVRMGTSLSAPYAPTPENDYVWIVEAPGLVPGDYFAVAEETARCKAGRSTTHAVW